MVKKESCELSQGGLPMLLFHIADIHLGKSINGMPLIDDQRYWINEFLKKCDEKDPDAVLIAGDVYDRVNPGPEAVDLLDYLLSELDTRDIPVFMIAGNHDSGPRLQFAHRILAKSNIHIAGKPTREVVHFTLDDPDGMGPVTFWLVPYIYPEAVASILEDDSIKTYSDAMTRLLEIQEIDSSHRNVILSHQNVVANGEEIERGGSETMTGGLGPMEYTVFDAFDYVALGHIHSGLPVGRSSVRYAGTPLCYHFDETKYKNKGIVEVVLGKKGDEIKPSVIPIAPLHKMHHISGTRDDIYDEVENRVGDGEYVGITMTDMRFTSEISDYLRTVITGRGGVLLETLSTYNEFTFSGVTATSGDVRKKPVEDLFADFYKAQTAGKDPSEDELETMRYLGELVRNGSESSNEENAQKLLNKLGKDKGDNV